jgi:hypothetical protein
MTPPTRQPRISSDSHITFVRTHVVTTDVHVRTETEDIT